MNTGPNEMRRRHLARLILAWSDMHKAKNACLQIIKHVKNSSDSLYHPLQEAAVVSYSRPFTHNEGYGSLPKKFEKFEEEKFTELHLLVLTQRDKHVAHSDKSEREVVVFNSGTHISIDIEPAPGHGFAVDYSNLSLSSIKELETMCNIQIKRLSADIGNEVNLIVASTDLEGLHELISLKKYKRKYLNN